MGHLQRSHGFTSSGKLSVAVTIGKEVPEIQTFIDCYLCGERCRLLELKRHLGKHQEQLALFAMPSYVSQQESDDDDKSAVSGDPDPIALDDDSSGSEWSNDQDANMPREERVPRARRRPENVGKRIL